MPLVSGRRAKMKFCFIQAGISQEAGGPQLMETDAILPVIQAEGTGASATPPAHSCAALSVSSSSVYTESVERKGLCAHRCQRSFSLRQKGVLCYC